MEDVLGTLQCREGLGPQQTMRVRNHSNSHGLEPDCQARARIEIVA
jgi:hypothetical protein